MPEKAKEIEINHYDRRADKISKDILSDGLNKVNFSREAETKSYLFWESWLRENCEGKTALDYGCGLGSYSSLPIEFGAERVVAIDLSEKSLEIAKSRNAKFGIKLEFQKADCENTGLPDSSFDLIFDRGTLYALNKEKAVSEIKRILKSKGCFIGIETFGHNFFTNIHREINILRGKRTKLSESNILKSNDLILLKRHFKFIDIHFFHVVSWLAFPFLDIPGGKFFLKMLEKIDDLLFFVLPFLKKYAFKVVFILSEPIK